MSVDAELLIELRKLFADKQYEYSDLDDGTGVIVSVETGKIVTLNGLGNQVISNVVSSTEATEVSGLIGSLAEKESTKHSVSTEIILGDMETFIRNLVSSLNQH